MADVPELTCRELVELVTDYLDGTLPRGEAERFEDHLTTCEGCAAYVDQMRHTIAVVGSLGKDSIPSPVREELLAAFRDWRRGRPDPTNPVPSTPNDGRKPID